MELKKFDVTFRLYDRNHRLSMHASCTVESKTQRIKDLFPAIYAHVSATHSHVNSTDYPNINLLYVYEHKYEDGTAYEQGVYTARNGPGGLMENPYIHEGIQQPEADQWHEGYTTELQRMHK